MFQEPGYTIASLESCLPASIIFCGLKLEIMIELGIMMMGIMTDMGIRARITTEIKAKVNML